MPDMNTSILLITLLLIQVAPAGQAVLEAPVESKVFVNDEPIEGRMALVPGDRLRLGEADSEILVVTMAV